MKFRKITAFMLSAALMLSFAEGEVNAVEATASSNSLEMAMPNERTDCRFDVQNEFRLRDEYNICKNTAAENSEAADLKYAEIPVEKLEVSNLSPNIDTALDYTHWWYSEWDDCRYIFLPATADRTKLAISYSCDETIYLDDTPVKSGEITSLLSKADEFKIKVGDKDCGTLKIMQSNLGCIYISTESGGLDALDGNRYLTESGNALMLNADGSEEYNGAIEKLTSHGNSSWDYSKKKPYNLKLPKKENLYGMGKAKKWALISNYLDHSMIRNKVTQEMCKAVGMEYVMDSVFVDLYADGSYRGTYQLYERVQIQKNRVNIRDLEEETEALNDKELEEYSQKTVGASNAGEYIENSYKYYDIPNNPTDITGGYLLQFQLWNRYGYKAESGFVTSRGQAVQIDGPEYASKQQVEYIRSFVQEAEDAIYSENGYNDRGRHYSDYIDVDSLITAYLVQEITMNIDATATSFYMWKDSDLSGDGKLHFSPAWDFDFSYNNFPTIRKNSDGKIGYSYRTDNLYTAYCPINGYNESGRPTVGISWLGQLYKQEDFVKCVSEAYFSRFEPFLSLLVEGENPYITQIAEEILPSAEMSNARWHTYGGAKYCVFGSSSGATFMDSVKLVGNFASDRKKWLSKLWEPYKFVRGDVNADGLFDVADLVMMQKAVLGSGTLTDHTAGNLSNDGAIDCFDLIMMRKMLLSV